MPTDQQILSNFADTLIQKIKDLEKQKNLRASGKTAEGLTKKTSDKQLQVIDKTGVFEIEEYGRKPGKKPPFKAIYDWLQYEKYNIKWSVVNTGGALRGVTAESQRKSIAWAIVNKIGKKGTYTHRTNPTGVLSEVINEESMQNLKGQIFQGKIDEIRTEIKRLWVSQ